LSSKTSKTDAEVKFARTQKRATDALRATNDAAAEAKRIDDNTARLRALRLARDAKEAADRARGVVPPAAPGTAKVTASRGAAALAKPAAVKAAPKTTSAKPVAAKATVPKAPSAKAMTPKAMPAKAMPAKVIPAKKLNARNDG
jgi:hypothetical protein